MVEILLYSSNTRKRLRTEETYQLKQNFPGISNRCVSYRLKEEILQYFRIEKVLIRSKQN